MSETGREIVQLLLAAGEITRADLHQMANEPLGHSPVPSVSAFASVVRAACPESSLRTYQTGFRRVVAAFGERRLDDVATSELQALCNQLQRDVQQRNGSSGSGAVRTLIHSARFFFRVAASDGLVSENPASALRLPPKSHGTRRALTSSELEQIWAVARLSGNDPVLDVLLLDFHRETAARRGGALALRIVDCSVDRCSVILAEKGQRRREVPATGDLMDRLLRHSTRRGVTDSTAQVFRFGNGKPLTRRRYNTLWERVQRELPWARELGVSMHWLRHTTLTDISQIGGGRIASAYAGHQPQTTTDIYTKPSFEDLQRAHRQLFGA